MGIRTIRSRSLLMRLTHPPIIALLVLLDRDAVSLAALGEQFSQFHVLRVSANLAAIRARRLSFTKYTKQMAVHFRNLWPNSNASKNGGDVLACTLRSTSARMISMQYIPMSVVCAE